MGDVGAGTFADKTYDQSESEQSKLLVTIVLPCLNEEGSVGECIDEATDALTAAGISGEVLIVDNNSTDRSVEVAMAHGARVIHERIPGYGSALRAGIKAALGEIVVMADADLTYDLSRVADLIKPVLDGSADIVLGERLSEAHRSTMPFLHRRVGTPMLTLLVRGATRGLTVTDSQSGYRAFRRDAVLNLGLTATGMEFASEMLIRAGKEGLRVVERSTGYRERVGDSKLNTFSDGWRHVRQILLLAPHLMLVAPGAIVTGLGVALLALGLIVPAGIDVGSLRWQPSFVSGVALVIGVQAIIAGLVLSEKKQSSNDGVRPYAPKQPNLPSLCLAVGLVLSVIGIGIDAWLFILWLDKSGPLSRGIALGSVAQSCLIDGVSLVGFGLIYPIVVQNSVQSNAPLK